MVALAAADDWLNEHETDESAHKSRRWLREPPTERQLAHLPPERRSDYSLTRYHASALLTFKFNRNTIRYLCVEGMTFGPDVETIDPDTGEVTTSARRVLPSHFKCPQTGNCLDVENPEIWVYPQGVLDDLTPPENDLTPEELGLTPHSSRKIKS